MDTRNESCGLPYNWCYYPHHLKDSLSPICGMFINPINFLSPRNMQLPQTEAIQKLFFSRIDLQLARLIQLNRVNWSHFTEPNSRIETAL